MRGDERAHARLVSGIADDERRARRHRPVESGGQIIEHHDLVSGIEEGVNRVAADVAGAASDQDRHVVSPFE
jgi:ribonuclease PH